MNRPILFLNRVLWLCFLPIDIASITVYAVVLTIVGLFTDVFEDDAYKYLVKALAFPFDAADDLTDDDSEDSNYDYPSPDDYYDYDFNDYANDSGAHYVDVKGEKREVFVEDAPTGYRVWAPWTNAEGWGRTITAGLYDFKTANAK